jgi:hypothetical protein
MTTPNAKAVIRSMMDMGSDIEDLPFSEAVLADVVVLGDAAQAVRAIRSR